MENYVKTQVQKTSRHILVVLLIPFIIFGFFTFREINSGFFNYNKITTAEELLSIKDTKGNAYVTFKAIPIFDTGYTYLSDNIVTGKYFLLDINIDNSNFIYALCIMPKNFEISTNENALYTIKGYLRTLDSVDKEALNAIVADCSEFWECTYEEAFAEFIPNLIIESKKTDFNFYFFTIGTAVFGLLSLWRLFILLEPKNSKLYKKLYKWGDLQNILDDIDREAEKDVSNKYLFQSSFFNFNVFKTDELMWAYKLITTHRTNGIKTGVTYSVLLRFKDKTSLSLNAKNEPHADTILSDLMPRFPNVIYGFTPELNTLYNKKLDEFIKQWENYKLEKKEQ